ncbi:MAG: cupin domain-containing protein [Candidatus Eremiobacteraeota bacterium]|nr:cupin domain-containing protein [Candidatus Eremiobacteraeota bacterium]
MGLHYALKDLFGKPPSEGNLATAILSHDDLEVEFYEPRGADYQQPHRRDEIYIIARGSGTFWMAGSPDIVFSAGDMLFAPAFLEHRFVEFSEDFASWVIFFGKEREA